MTICSLSGFISALEFWGHLHALFGSGTEIEMGAQNRVDVQALYIVSDAWSTTS